MERTIAKPRRRVREPAWEVARFYPLQGDWTERDYLRLPDNTRIELSNGRLEFLPMPSLSHQLIIAFVYEALVAYLAKSFPNAMVLFASVPVRLKPNQMREPDVLVVLAGRTSQRFDEFVEHPDLVVEVLSPSNRENDLVEKRSEYAEAGIPEYWIVDPQAKHITVLVLKRGKYVEHGQYGRAVKATSVLLKGFEVDVSTVWQKAGL